MADGAGMNNPSPAPGRTWDPPETPVEVIGPQFIKSQHPVELTISWNKARSARKYLEVADVEGTLLSQIKNKTFTMHNRNILHDANGKIMLTLRHKMRTMHGRWEVFRGKNEDDLLFSAKRSSAFGTKNQLHIFLSSNTTEEIPNYKIDGSWSDKSFIVSLGGSNTTIAEIIWKRDKIAVKVAPCVDYAFIATLVVFLGSFDPPVSLRSAFRFTFGGVQFLLAVLGLAVSVN